MPAELSRLRRPNARNSISGDALIMEATMPLARPGGDIAGARAMNTSTFSLRVGWIDSVAKAWAVPCENPIYDNDACAVVERMYSIVSGMS